MARIAEEAGEHPGKLRRIWDMPHALQHAPLARWQRRGHRIGRRFERWNAAASQHQRGLRDLGEQRDRRCAIAQAGRI